MNRPVVRFDITNNEILNNEVTKATLILNYYKKAFIVAETNFNVYPLTNGWDESTSTWSHRDETNEWNEPGGEYDNSISTSGSLSPDNLGEINIDVTEHVKAMLNGSIENHGFLIICTDEMYKQLEYNFASSENSDASIRPKLVIDYSETPISDIKDILTKSSLNILNTGNHILIDAANTQKTELSIFTLNGKHILTLISNNGSFKIDKNNFISGLYLFNLNNQSSSIRGKFNISD